MMPGQRLLSLVLAVCAVSFSAACGSEVAARPAALDPSNPEGPEAPALKLVDLEEINGSLPVTPDPHQHGTAKAPEANAHHPTAAPDSKVPGAESATYVCPMHPEVTSDRPGTCPKCGMKLVLEKSSESSTPAHDHAHHGSMPEEAKP